MTNTNQVKIKFLTPEAKIPTKAHDTDACYDVYAISKTVIHTLPDLSWKYYLADLATKHSFIDKLLHKIHWDFTIKYPRLDTKVIKYGLGFSLELPKDSILRVYPRSSIYKTGLVLANSVATGDEGYTGEYSLIFYHVVPSLSEYEIGDKIAQIEVVSRSNINWEVVEELDSTERSDKGFGSSGR
jgi:dUTP pyrophosphatase